MMTRKSNIWLPFWVGVILLILIGAWVAACSAFLLNPGSNDLVLIPSPTLVTVPNTTPAPMLTPTLASAATATLAKATPIPSPVGIASTTFVPPLPTVPPVITAWRGEYFSNPGLAGNPALVRDDPSVLFDWSSGAPGPGLPSDAFSARWTRSLWFGEGLYRFYLRADDGVRLWVDGELIVDQWHEAAGTNYTADRSLGEGNHALRIEYFDNKGPGLIQFWWDRVGNFPLWRGEYFANPNLSGAPALTRSDANVDFNWGNGAPATGLPNDGFSVRWTRLLAFEQGQYRFHASVDDGIRLYVDGNLIIDQWNDGALRELTADAGMAAGYHILRIEYYDRIGNAAVRVWWEKLAVTSFPDWRGEYWSNPNLTGNTALVRNDTAIDFDWGNGAPASGLPADGFSARWTRAFNFPGGMYRFRVVVDDGARLWVDNALVVDEWHDGVQREVTADYALVPGTHIVRVEYYEHTGVAAIHVSWDSISVPSFPNWKGEYWSNKDLSGLPILVRNDQSINFDWGAAPPVPGMPASDWSVRWSRQISFTTGNYRFYLQADDGIRFYVDGIRVVDQWHDSSGDTPYTADLSLTGQHSLTVEYYQHTGSAKAQVRWEQLLTPTSTSTSTPTATATPTVSLTPTPSSTPTASPTATASSTATRTPTSTPTMTPTMTPSITPAATSTRTATSTATASPTRTAAFTATATSTATATITLTPTSSSTLTATPTTTLAATPTLSVTATTSSTLTATPTVTSTVISPTEPPISRIASPDKHWTAVLNNLNGSLDLVRADGKTFTLFSSGGTLGPITWSPDSHRLIIAQVRPPQTGLGGALLSIVGVNTAGANVIWQVKTTGDQPDKPAQILELAMGPANDDRVVWGEWSPNSRYVLFWVGSSSPSIAADGLPLRMLDTETGQSTLIDTTVVNRRYQSWSPESSRLVLSAGGDRSAQVNKWLELFTVSPPQVTTVVSKTEQIPGIVAWSPRGTWIAYAAVAAADTGSDAYLMTWQNPAIAKRRIFLLNPATRERIRLNNMDTFQDAPAWSDDGTTLYYVQRDKSDIVLAATNPVTSTVRLVEESRRPAPQVIGYYGQSRWEDVLAYRPDAPREPLPALTQTLTDTVNGYVLRYPAGWAVDNGWHSTGFDCTGCPALNPSADGTPFDPGPFSGQIFIGLQSLAYTGPTLDAALKQVLAQPGPGQGSSLVSFAQRRVTVDNRNAIRVETMDDIGTINHVLLVGYGKQLLVLRGWGDGRVFDAIVSTINLR